MRDVPGNTGRLATLIWGVRIRISHVMLFDAPGTEALALRNKFMTT